MKIGINASGGDDSVQTMLGAYQAANDNPEIEVELYLDLPHYHLIDANIMMFPRVPANLVIIEVDKGKDLSIILNLLQEGKINALITGSNSKVLATSSHQAGMFKSPFRPGLLAPIPVKAGISYMLDVGATARVDDPQVFKGWAELGARFLKAHCGVGNPTIGLCNIAGERAYPALQKVHHLLAVEVSNYFGYIEPDKFVEGDVNLWLMEGFVGNGNLKLLEAYMRFLTHECIVAAVDPCDKRRIKELAQNLFSYEAHLISPYLTESGCWIFRVHGAAKAPAIAKAFTLARQNYDLTQPMW